MDETVTITMTRDHAWVVQDACEMLMRMKLGQTIMPTELMLEWPNGDMTWYEYCLRRDVAKSALTTFLTAVGCPEGTPKDDTEHMAYEIYGTIRHALYLADGGDPNGWGVAAQEPLSESGRPMPKCEVTNDG
jgi:hypothetical protein